MNGNALGPGNVGRAIQEIGGILLILEDTMISTCKQTMCQALSIQESSSKNVLFEELNKLNSKVVPSFVYPLVKTLRENLLNFDIHGDIKFGA
jgi:hypothetical protein